MQFDIIIQALIATGFTVILVLSKLVAPVRELVISKFEVLRDLITCPMCMGFWIGAFMFPICFEQNPFYGACLTSLFSWSISAVIDAVQSVGTYFEAAISIEEE